MELYPITYMTIYCPNIIKAAGRWFAVITFGCFGLLYSPIELFRYILAYGKYNGGLLPIQYLELAIITGGIFFTIGLIIGIITRRK